MKESGEFFIGGGEERERERGGGGERERGGGEERERWGGKGLHQLTGTRCATPFYHNYNITSYLQRVTWNSLQTPFLDTRTPSWFHLYWKQKKSRKKKQIKLPFLRVFLANWAILYLFFFEEHSFIRFVSSYVVENLQSCYKILATASIPCNCPFLCNISISIDILCDWE